MVSRNEALTISYTQREPNFCLPAHIVKSTIRGYHSASPHVSDETIVFDL
jgi:hypothetical protein